MAKKKYEESNIQAIATAIREKTGLETTYKTSEMADGVGEVFESGKQDVISNSKYIEKSASGKVIRLDDVSEVAHKVVVKADEDTEVNVYGKNLFNNDTSLLKEVTYTGSSGTQGTRIGYEPYVLPAGTYTFTITDLNPSYGKFIYGMICTDGNKFVRSCSLLQSTANHTPLTVTVNEGEKVFIYNGHAHLNVNDRAAEFAQVQIQLEVGSVATPYEEYQEPQTITATPSGTEIPSNCPNMTFLADNDVTVEYYGSYVKQADYDWFWDIWQTNGARTNYTYAFYGLGWTNALFKPKYDIKPNACTGLFQGTRITDLVTMLERAGVSLDTSGIKTGGASLFASAYLTRVPYFVAPAITSATHMFNGASILHTVLGVYCNEINVYTNWFYGCTALEKIIFHGIIADNINMQWSTKLTLESLLSLINCLKNFNGSTEEWTKTITLSTESWDLLKAQGNIFSWADMECDITYYLSEGIRWNMA